MRGCARASGLAALAAPALRVPAAAMPARAELDARALDAEAVGAARKCAALSPDGSTTSTEGQSASLSPAFSDGSGAPACSQSLSSSSPGGDSEESGSVSDASSSGSDAGKPGWLRGSCSTRQQASQSGRGAESGKVSRSSGASASTSSSSESSTASLSASASSAACLLASSTPEPGGEAPPAAASVGAAAAGAVAPAKPPKAQGRNPQGRNPQGRNPQGPAPKGMRWDGELGQWVPRGDAPAGLTWDCAKSRWTQVSFEEGVPPLSSTRYCEWDDDHGRWVLAPLPDSKTKPLYASSRIFSSSGCPGAGHASRFSQGHNRRSGRLPRRELDEGGGASGAGAGQHKRARHDEAGHGVSRLQTGSPPCLDAVHGAVQHRRPTPQRAAPGAPALQQLLPPQPYAALSPLFGVFGVPGGVDGGAMQPGVSLFTGVDLSPVLHSVVLQQQQQNQSPAQLLDPALIKPMQFTAVPMHVPAPVHVGGAMVACPQHVGPLICMGLGAVAPPQAGALAPPVLGNQQQTLLLGLGAVAPPQAGALAPPVLGNQQQTLLQAQILVQHQMLQQIIQQLEQQQHALLLQQQLRPLPCMTRQAVPDAGHLLAGLGMSPAAAQSTLDGALGMLALPRA